MTFWGFRGEQSIFEGENWKSVNLQSEISSKSCCCKSWRHLPLIRNITTGYPCIMKIETGCSFWGEVTAFLGRHLNLAFLWPFYHVLDQGQLLLLQNNYYTYCTFCKRWHTVKWILQCSWSLYIKPNCSLTVSKTSKKLFPQNVILFFLIPLSRLTDNSSGLAI